MGGKAREVGEPITRNFDDEDGDAGLDSPGYCLKISAAAAPELTLSASGSAVYAVAYTDTRDPLYDGINFTVVYWKDPEVACIREGTVEVHVDGADYRSTAIHVGDIVGLGAEEGHVAHFEDNVSQDAADAAAGDRTMDLWMAARAEIVGVSEEYLAADADPTDDTGKILVRLTILGEDA